MAPRTPKLSARLGRMGWSRRNSQKLFSTQSLPYASNSSFYSPLAILFMGVMFVSPLAYTYTGLWFLRRLAIATNTLTYLTNFSPILANFFHYLSLVPSSVNLYSFLECVFYLFLTIKFRIFSNKDPLEMSLAASPMLTRAARWTLFNNILDAEKDDPIPFIRGWFFDANIADISRYDVLDYLCWALYEGRNQEHLTVDEAGDLTQMLAKLEDCISTQQFLASKAPPIQPTPFRFHSPQTAAHRNPFHFSTLFTTLKESRVGPKASKMYEALPDLSTARRQLRQTFTNSKAKIVRPGGKLDTALHSAQSMSQSLASQYGPSQYIGNTQKDLRRKLHAYETLLANMRQYSTHLSGGELARVMNRITAIVSELQELETDARMAYSILGRSMVNMMKPKVPLRFAKYNVDPLFDVQTYPLIGHLAMTSVTIGVLGILLRRRGFVKYRVGRINYWLRMSELDVARFNRRTTRSDSYEIPDADSNPQHIETLSSLHSVNLEHSDSRDSDASFINPTPEPDSGAPIVAIHGIGIGLLPYMAFIDRLVATGRTVFLPEVDSVTGFRCWETSASVKSPATVASTLSAMIGSHGFFKAAFIGHSYGTSWVSFVCQYSPQIVDSVVFLDPICFSLHLSHLTRMFVYQRSDPGGVSYVVRTDLMVHYTLQRSFPWTRVALFADQLPPGANCAVFLSEKDCLVASAKVKEYWAMKGAYMSTSDNYDDIERSGKKCVDNEVFVTTWIDYDHGDFLMEGKAMDAVVSRLLKL